MKKFSLLTLVFTLSVIVWGAYVRASYSGDGCGKSWPLCNEQIIPQNAVKSTFIELAHRASSGLDLIMVALLCVLTLRRFSLKSLIGKASVAALSSIVLEAFLGAMLVVFGLVVKNQSMARIILVAFHLTNTLMLLGSLTLVSTSLFFPNISKLFAGVQKKGNAQGVLALFFLLSALGALTALADTLYPVQTLQEGVQADFSRSAPWLVRLRIFHPFLAVAFWVRILRWLMQEVETFDLQLLKRPLFWFWSVLTLNLALGFVSILELTPVSLQLLHLGFVLVAWVALVFSLQVKKLEMT